MVEWRQLTSGVRDGPIVTGCDRRGVLLGAGLGVGPGGVSPTALTVTPNANLVNAQTVTVEGSGYQANIQIAYCQGVDDGSPGLTDCRGRSIEFATTSPTGTFTAQLTVYRIMTVGERADYAVVQSAIRGRGPQRHRGHRGVRRHLVRPERGCAATRCPHQEP